VDAFWNTRSGTCSAAQPLYGCPAASLKSLFLLISMLSELAWADGWRLYLVCAPDFDEQGSDSVLPWM
jgi:hypothetical protein